MAAAGGASLQASPARRRGRTAEDRAPRSGANHRPPNVQRGRYFPSRTLRSRGAAHITEEADARPSRCARRGSASDVPSQTTGAAADVAAVAARRCWWRRRTGRRWRWRTQRRRSPGRHTNPVLEVTHLYKDTHRQRSSGEPDP